MGIGDPVGEASGFREDIEGLRGLAILLVVLFHAHVPGFQGGFVGVDVFFVISGFLITRLLVREWIATGKMGLKEFYARRMRRLVPAGVVVLLVTISAMSIIYSPLEQIELGRSATAAAVYLSNILFAYTSSGYFSGDLTLDPFLHTWSLGVEEQLYLIWPWVVMGGLWIGRRESRSLRIAWSLLAVGGVSLAVSVWLTDRVQPFGFFISPSRAWEFAAGGLTWCGSQRGDWSNKVLRECLRLAGVGAITAAVIAFDSSTPFPGISAAVPVLGTCALLMAGPGGGSIGVGRVLDNRAIRFLGSVSYSWYLWHWPVLVVLDARFGSQEMISRLAVSVLALLLAVGTYYVVEVPVRHAAFFAARAGLTIVLGLGALMVGVGVTAGFRAVAFHASQSPEQQRYFVAQRTLPVIYALGCHMGYSGTSAKGCTFGAPDADTVAILFGDSHAAQWFPAIADLVSARKWRLVSFTKSGCPYPDVTVRSLVRQRDYVECTEWRTAVIERIRAINPTFVFVASSRIRSGPMVGLDMWALGVRRTVSALAGSARHVFVINDTPVPSFNVLHCLSRAVWVGAPAESTCAFSRTGSVDTVGQVIEKREAGRIPGVSVIEPSSQICGVVECRPEIDGVIVYRDQHHITNAFAIYLEPLLSRAITQVEGAEAKIGK